MQAPIPLILSVLVSSMNSDPKASVPRTKTGTCKGIRGERLVEGTSKPLLSPIKSRSTETPQYYGPSTEASIMNAIERVLDTKQILQRESFRTYLKPRTLKRREDCPRNPLPFLKS